VVVGYQQSLGDAVYITFTGLAATAGSYALVRDVGHWRTSMSKEAAARNGRAPWRWFIEERPDREDLTDPEQVDRLSKVIAWIGVVVGSLILGAEVIAVTVNGVR
jgi:hypothetical protein